MAGLRRTLPSPHSAGAAGCMRTMPRRSSAGKRHKLVVGLARGVYRRHDRGTFRGWLRRVVGNEVVDLARRQGAGQPAGDVLHCWPDPVSIDELAGELDEEFRVNRSAS